jgi:hypothetical protein
MILLDLINELELNEDERPTSSASERAKELLRLVDINLNGHLPHTNCVCEFNGGIRILWIHDDYEIRVMIGASLENRSYIYLLKGGTYSGGLIEPLNDVTLTDCLKLII